MVVRVARTGIWEVLAPYGTDPRCQIPTELEFGPRATLDLDFIRYAMPAPEFERTVRFDVQAFNVATGEEEEEDDGDGEAQDHDEEEDDEDIDEQNDQN